MNAAAAAAAPNDLYDFGPVLTALLDPSGLVLAVNEAGCQLLDKPRRHVVGMPFRILVVDEDRRTFLDHLRRCRMGMGVVETDLRLRRKSGHQMVIRLYSRPARLQGRVVYPSLAIDLSDYAALEQARQRTERERDQAEREREVARAGEVARDHMIAVVSHELRNPLSPALVAAEALLSRADRPDVVRQLATIIKRNIQLEARLIDDLLDVARVTRGQLQLTLKVTDVHLCLLDSVGSTNAAAAAKSIRVSLDLQAANHHAVADGARLRQVFWNLLSNAIKFSDDGGGIVVRTTNDAGTAIRITIRDQGRGMDAETLATVFTPFKRQAEARPGGGLGLGLTITRGIVESHGGQIRASSEGLGRGAIFEVILQTCPAPVLAPKDDVAVSQPGGGDTPARRVLLVEDHDDTGALLSLFLAERGCDVTLARSLLEARPLLDRPWDVVLSDIGLPDGSGLDIARHLVAADRRPAKMIAISGFGTARDTLASRQAGFDEHLVKPVDLVKLHAMLESIGSNVEAPRAREATPIVRRS